MKTWFDHDRSRNEVTALRHWEPVNGRLVRAQDDRLAVACLAQVGPAPGGGPLPAGDDWLIAEALARLHAFPIPKAQFPTLESYLRSTIELRVRRRLRRYGFGSPSLPADWELHAKPASISERLLLLHADLYRENVPFTAHGRPVFLDPLPMLGDPAFDWAFFIVYFDLARDPVPRLHMASLVSRIGIPALVPWCLRLCLDGLLYYREASDDREHRMEEVMSALAAECPKLS